MIFNSRFFRIFSIVFAVLVLLLTVIYKIKKYNLFYYQDDIFTVLQMTKSWLSGHSFLWDNRYGHVEKIHFSYVAVLLSPFTVLAGGKGLFYAHALFYLLVFCFLIYAKRLNLSLWERISIGILFLLGPYAFFVFDDEGYGWHLEFLFIPFCFFFMVALLKQNKWQIIFWSLILCLTKEDGPVIACCIHLAYWFAKGEGKWKDAAKICAGWFFIFFATMFLLKVANHFEQIRFEDALSDFMNDNTIDKGSYFIKLLGELLLLLFPLMAFLSLFLSLKKTGWLLLFLLPVIAVCMVSGIYYYPNTMYSFSWAPRWVEIMAFLFCGSILFLHFIKGELPEEKIHVKTQRGKVLVNVVVLVLCLAFQTYALGKTRRYFLFSEIAAVVDGKLPGYLKPGPASLVTCVSKQIPAEYSVVVPHYYFNVFEHCNCFSFDHPENAPANPDLIILKDTVAFEKYKASYNYAEYKIEKKRSLYFLQLKGSKISLDECN